MRRSGATDCPSPCTLDFLRSRQGETRRRRLGGEMRTKGPLRFVAGLRAELEARKLEAAVARGREEERKQIGQALHDGAGQLLAVALMQLRTLARQTESQAIGQLHALLKTTLDEVVGL